jgi:hypothetical protein
MLLFFLELLLIYSPLKQSKRRCPSVRHKEHEQGVTALKFFQLGEAAFCFA